jgi:hypothetical protein
MSTTSVGLTVTIDGQPLTLRLSTAALQRLEAVCAKEPPPAVAAALQRMEYTLQTFKPPVTGDIEAHGKFDQAVEYLKSTLAGSLGDIRRSTRAEDVFFPDIIRSVRRGSIWHTIRFFWAAATDAHPQLTVEAFEQLIDRAGGWLTFLGQVSGVVDALVLTTQPSEQDRVVGRAGDQTNPPSRPRGVRGGTSSTGRPGAPASTTRRTARRRSVKSSVS